MKILITTIIILLSIGNLFSDRKSLQEFISDLNSEKILKGINTYKSDYFDPNLIKTTLSSSKILKKIKDTKINEDLFLENIIITDSLNINNNNCNLNSIVFLNCQFEGNIVFNNPKIDENLIFSNCKTENQILFNDFSTQNLSLIRNEVNEFLYDSKYLNNSMDNFILYKNSFEKYKLRGFNPYIDDEENQSSNIGTLEIKNFFLAASNNFINSFISGIKFSIFYLESNNINNIEINKLKFKKLFVFQNNYIKKCTARNFDGIKEDRLFFTKNTINSFYIQENKISEIFIINNNLDKLYIDNLFCDLQFDMTNNSFTDDASIFIKECDINKIDIISRKDSLNKLEIDTLYNLSSKKNNELNLDNDYIKFYDKKTNKYLYTKLNTIRDKVKNKKSSVQIYGTPISDSNWFVDFDFISATEEKYNLNSNDSILESRHEIYSSLKKVYGDQGKWTQADNCYYEWKEFHRKNYWELSNDNFFIKIPNTVFHYLNWLSCGYGIKPLWIFPFAFIMILIFALIYFITPMPISSLEEHFLYLNNIKSKLSKLTLEELKEKFKDLDLDFNVPKQKFIDVLVSSLDGEVLSKKLNMKPKSRFNIKTLWHSYYFSFSTFTTIGIGDWYPSGEINKAIVMIEGALGWLCLGLFIVTYANILLR